MIVKAAALTHALHEPAIRAADRLVVALDVPEIEQARVIVASLGQEVSIYKVGHWLYLVPGVDKLIDDLIAMGKQVLLDAKIADITETMRAGVAGAARRGASFLTIHGNGEVKDEALEAAIEARGSSKLKLLLVTVMTHLDDLDLQKIGYGGKSVRDLAKDRTERAIRFGFDGVIASGYEVADVRSIAGARDFLAVTPGIRPSGAPREDQKRAVTPNYAITNGADYLVVGRPIIRALDPLKAAGGILEEMQKAFDALRNA